MTNQLTVGHCNYFAVFFPTLRQLHIFISSIKDIYFIAYYNLEDAQMDQKYSSSDMKELNMGRKVWNLHWHKIWNIILLLPVIHNIALRSLITNFVQTCIGHDLGWVNWRREKSLNKNSLVLLSHNFLCVFRALWWQFKPHWQHLLETCKGG